MEIKCNLQTLNIEKNTAVEYTLKATIEHREIRSIKQREL